MTKQTDDQPDEQPAPPPHHHRRVCDTHGDVGDHGCHCGEDHGTLSLPCGPWCPENPEADPYAG